MRLCCKVWFVFYTSITWLEKIYNGAFPSFLKLESSTPYQSSAWKRATIFEISQFEFQERKKVKWFGTAGGWVNTWIASQSLFFSVSRCGCLLWILSLISDFSSPSPDFQPLVSDRSVERRRCMNIHSHQVRMICKSLVSMDNLVCIKSLDLTWGRKGGGGYNDRQLQNCNNNNIQTQAKQTGLCGRKIL